MIADPYIRIKGEAGEYNEPVGTIEWFSHDDNETWWYDGSWHDWEELTKDWQPYADFEREKLKELVDDRNGSDLIRIDGQKGYTLLFTGENFTQTTYCSIGLIGYSTIDYIRDSESYRFFARVKFLKFVCEKEGVEWLPGDKCKYCGLTGSHKCDPSVGSDYPERIKEMLSWPRCQCCDKLMEHCPYERERKIKAMWNLTSTERPSVSYLRMIMQQAKDQIKQDTERDFRRSILELLAAAVDENVCIKKWRKQLSRIRRTFT